MKFTNRLLNRLKHYQQVRLLEGEFDPSIIPQGIQYHGCFTNDGTLRDLLIGAKLFKFDPVLGHRYNKASAILFLRDNGRLERYLCITDQDGFVPNSLDALPTKERLIQAKHRGQTTIFIFGGSTVAHGSGFLPDSEIATRLEQLLEKEHPGRFIVVNAGVGGYTTDNQFRYLLYNVLPLQPDIVIFYDGWNDCTYLNGLISTHGNDFIRGSVRQSYSMLALYESSMSVRRLAAQTAGLTIRKAIESIDRAGFLGRITPRIALNPMAADIRRLEFCELSLGVYACNIFYAHALCLSVGARFIHFLQPLLTTGNKVMTPYERNYIATRRNNSDIALYKEFYDRFESRRFRGSELLEKVPDVSLRHILDTASEELFIDDGHVVKQGNNTIAQAIIRHL